MLKHAMGTSRYFHKVGACNYACALLEGGPAHGCNHSSDQDHAVLLTVHLPCYAMQSSLTAVIRSASCT